MRRQRGITPTTCILLAFTLVLTVALTGTAFAQADASPGASGTGTAAGATDRDCLRVGVRHASTPRDPVGHRVAVPQAPEMGPDRHGSPRLDVPGHLYRRGPEPYRGETLCPSVL